MVKKEGEVVVENVGRVFIDHQNKQITALQDINLKINPGEFVSIIGPSGCGKSTLLRIIAGLDTPTHGKAYLDGDEIEGPSYERGLVFQDPTLFPWLNVYQNIATGLVARKVYKERKHEIDDYIALVGIKGFEHAFPHQLSGGMAQRVSIARSLVNHPKVLLLDEPLGALDAFTRMYMQDELLRIWRERGNTTVLITHDVDEAIYLSDRIYVMSPRPGHVVSSVEVGLAHKRERDSKEFLDIKHILLKNLNFSSQ